MGTIERHRKRTASTPIAFGLARAALPAILVAAMAILPQAAAAQNVITGIVTAQDSGDPLPSASVRIRGTERGVLTGPAGRFTLSGLTTGTHVLEVSSLGYRSVVRSVELTSGQPLDLTFGLIPRPLELGGVQVVVLRPDLLPRAELTEREVRRANPKDSGELLRVLDGVDAVRRGPLGLDPVIRGLRETQVGTYLDGTRLFPAGPARMDSPLTHLDPSAVQDIEVAKGPYALTWGAGNLSAIRVETAPLPGAFEAIPRGSADLGYDTNLGATELSASMASREGRISYWGFGAWRTGSDYEDGNGGSIPADYRSWEGRGKLGFDVGDASQITVGAGYQRQGPIDYPGRLLTADFFEATNLSLRWETDRSEGLLRNLKAGLYRNDVDHGMNNAGKPTAEPMEGRMPPFALDIRIASGIEVWGGNGSVELVEGPWSFQLGGDLYSANRGATRTIRRADNGMVLFEDLMWPDATITDVGLFSRTSRTFESGLRFAGTLRLDLVSADADTASAFLLDHVSDVYGITGLDANETNVSGALTLGVSLNPRWELSAGIGSAVRTADATERYSDRIPATKAQMSAEFMGNPTLEPERSTQLDLWLEGSLPNAAVSLNLFARRVDDYITLEATDLPKRLPLSPDVVYRYINGEATFYGAEGSVLFALTDVLTVDVGGSALVGTDVTLDEPILGISPLGGRLGLRYEDLGGRYFLEGVFRAVARQEEVSLSRNENATPGYGVLNLRAGWAPVSGVNLRIGIENAFDKGFVNHLNARNPFSGDRIPEPGRVLYMDVGYRF